MDCANYLKGVSNFSKPLPLIGMYIATASVFCGALLWADFYIAIVYLQFWFPCRYFSLNSASLMIIGAATKLSLDLTTSMPGKFDQLSKLSSSILFCNSMGIFIPSLGKMRNTELVTNLMALIIFVITVIVNLCVQLSTGVIYQYMPSQIIVLCSMVFLLLVYCSTAIALVSIKNELQVKYEKKHQLAVNEFTNGAGEMNIERLEHYLMKFFMMSHTGSPYMALGRSKLGSTAAFICVVDSLCLVPMFYVGSCETVSDYNWTTYIVFSIQCSAILFVSVVSSIKLIGYPIPQNMQILSSITNVVKIEGYWTQWLVEIKQRPFFLFIHNKQCRKFVHHAKYHFCNVFIAIQIATVLMIKAFGSSYNLLMASHRGALHRTLWNIGHLRSLYLLNSPSRANPVELRPYILFLEGEEELIGSMMEIALHASRRYLKMAKEKEPDHLVKFLESSLSHGFEGAFEFDSDQVCCLDSEEPPTHCWSLPVVTMTSIAISLPNIDRCLVDKLLKSVREGLVFVKLIEENLNKDTDSINMRKAADIVWEQVDIHGRCLDVKLNELAARGNQPTHILNFLVDSVKNNFQAFKRRKEKTSIWPIEAVASNSLYRICQTILHDCQHENSQLHTTNDMFKMLSSRICDILGACLTNLEYLILTECSRSTIENMNETAQRVLNLFGRAKKVMELLDAREKPNLSSDQLVFLDKWRCSPDNITNHLP